MEGPDDERESGGRSDNATRDGERDELVRLLAGLVVSEYRRRLRGSGEEHQQTGSSSP